MPDDQERICSLIRQLRLIALAQRNVVYAAALYDAADWLQRLAGLTREQVDGVNK